MKTLLAVTFALAVAAPSAALGQAPFLGGRIGYGIPFGSTAEVGSGTISQRDVVSSVVPFQVDAGYQLGQFDLGGYLSYGFASAGSRCPGSCSANDLRLGVQAALRSPIRPEREVWAGILFGWQRTKAGDAATASGWEAGVQGGFDFATRSFGFGPFGMLTFGKYGSLDLGGASVSSFTTKVHGMLQLGVRGFFRL